MDGGKGTGDGGKGTSDGGKGTPGTCSTTAPANGSPCTSPNLTCKFPDRMVCTCMGAAWSCITLP
jgi:hypothetical protein